MRIIIDKKYLILPVSNRATLKKLLFTENERILFDLDIKLDAVSPDYHVFINTERWHGKIIDLECEPNMSFPIWQENEKNSPVTDEGERFRPLFHFAPKDGWLNDPNGLVYDGELYHLFFQHNPVGRDWGNMHWGHAVSRDLVRWEELDCALYPDETGTMYSGSAIMDVDNRLKLQPEGASAMLLYYTAAGGTSRLSSGARFTQCLAYSIDKGKTFHKYKNKPVLPFIEAENRDPKVIYHPASNRYVMSLYLADDRYALFCSDNLLDWTKTQELALKGDAECPDFYFLTDADGNEKWILSGASDRYMVGSFDGHTFTPETESKQLHFGKHSYAAQTWSNVPDGRRIRIAWNTYDIASPYISRAMTFPCELRLTEDLSLAVLPIDEIKTLYQDLRQASGIHLPTGGVYTLDLSTKCYDISLTLSGLENGTAALFFFGVTIVLDGQKNEIQTCGSAMPLHTVNGSVCLRLLVDVTGFELFSGEGRAYMSQGFMMDYNLNRLCINAFANGFCVETLDIAALKL